MNDTVPTERIENVNQATLHYLSEHPKYFVYAALIAIPGILLGLFFQSVVPGFFALMGPLIIYAYIQGKMLGYMMQQFARDRGFEFSDTGEMESVHGALFSAGHSQSIIDVISGKEDGRPVRIFCYSYKTGSGKSEETHHYTVLENTFTGAVPHILLSSDSLSSAVGGERYFSNDEVLMEGDFSKYFSLYVQKEFEIEAYQIFTPDFMQELIETSKEYNFEFSENKLYIYTPDALSSRAKLEAMFALADKLCTRLAPVVDRMKDDVQNMDALMGGDH